MTSNGQEIIERRGLDLVDDSMTSGPVTFKASEAEMLFYVLLAGYQLGKLTVDEFKRILKYLMFYDIEGNLWTMGAISGEWYRRVGEEWVLGSPYGPLMRAHGAKASEATPEESRKEKQIGKSSAQEREEALKNPIIREFLNQARE